MLDLSRRLRLHGPDERRNDDLIREIKWKISFELLIADLNESRFKF
jgi:hypothetical protein